MHLKKDSYIIITTLCNKEEIANKIVDTLLSKKLVAGSQVSIVQSKYWWNNKIEECNEYKLEFRTKKSLYNEIKRVIDDIHDYDVKEISCHEIIKANPEFLSWIDINTKEEP